MLVLYETSAGYSLFKVADEKKLNNTDADELYDKVFNSAEKTKSLLNLVSFQPFSDTADAVTAASACVDGRASDALHKFVKKGTKKQKDDNMVVADKALGISLKEQSSKLTITNDAKTNELYRGIRMHLEALMEQDLSPSEMRAMQLGLSHSLSRFKLKFSADKVDTMVIQAVGLLDELDKEINIYAMRVKEWYGWHFPELQRIVADNGSYAKLVVACGMRSNFKNRDLVTLLGDENLANAAREAAEVSMGTDIVELDVVNITSLAEQVLSLMEYRGQLYDYLKNRMNAIAPNLTILLGELVGARLISHAGSLLNLAKQPASTVQILGAEKALFRALKTKHDTPKYGLIYHASLIGQAQPKNKGKVSRVLAAKAALAIRVDALSDDVTPDTTLGYECRSKVEARLRQLEGFTSEARKAVNKDGALTVQNTSKYDATAAKMASDEPTYDTNKDMVLDESPDKKAKKDKKKKKRKAEEIEADEPVVANGNHAADEGDEKAAKKAKKAAKKAKKERKSKG